MDARRCTFRKPSDCIWTGADLVAAQPKEQITRRRIAPLSRSSVPLLLFSLLLLLLVFGELRGIGHGSGPGPGPGLLQEPGNIPRCRCVSLAHNWVRKSPNYLQQRGSELVELVEPVEPVELVEPASFGLKSDSLSVGRRQRQTFVII